MSENNANTAPLKVSNKILDKWATDPVGPVALRLKQSLRPVEESGIIFPPTYADIGYNVDTLSDGTRVATIDSVGSQANRLEPIFKSESSDREDWLVPQIEVVIRSEECGECDTCKENAETSGKKGKKECENPHQVERSILDLAHRAADAVVQSSPTLLPIVERAFQALRREGDAGPLCEIAPTSLVFGVWDSRGASGEKRPRLVRSVIRAWDVEPLHAAAQFNSLWKGLDEAQQEELEKEAKAKQVKLSVKGLADAPAVFRKMSTSAGRYMQEFRDGLPNPERRVLGGVIPRGGIEREVIVNLVALRGLRGTLLGESDAGNRADGTDDIRKYLLGLSLVAATTDIDLFLREGCLLQYADDKDLWYQVPRRGTPTPVDLSADVVREYVKEAGKVFRSGWPEDDDLKHKFDLAAAKKLLAKKTAEEAEEAIPE